MSTIKLPICKIILDQPLKRSNIRSFRGAVSEAVGLGNILFHNHTDDTQKPLRFRYPLVQYKVQQGKAAIIGLAEGAIELRKHISLDGEFFAGTFPILSRSDENFKLAMTAEPKPYYLAQWLALNQTNAERWGQFSSTAAQQAELQRILVAHLLAFAAGMGFDVPRPKGLEVGILEFAGPRRASYHGARFSSFDVRFTANINLPFDIGIGKSASHGFGCIWKPRSYIRKLKSKPAAQFSFEW
ncbi:MAG TPA: hypothetical protein ENJ95_04425 [Bacteroidetes bacterium]|nr:hypothetical protein [Bacteroidota bacterium]